MSNIIKGPLNMCYSTERLEDLKITTFETSNKITFLQKRGTRCHKYFYLIQKHQIETPLIAKNQF